MTQIHKAQPPLPAHQESKQPQMTEHEFKDNPSAHGGYNYEQQLHQETQDDAR